MKSDSFEKIKIWIDELDRDYLYFSPEFYRTLICPTGCGGCCLSFTKDYLKGSVRWNLFKQSYPELVHLFSGRQSNGVTLYTYSESEKGIHFCSFLDGEARCKIHQSNPFPCEFETIKLRKEVNAYRKGFDCTTLHDRGGFGRGWSFKTFSGKGSLCKFKPMKEITLEVYSKKLSLIKELQEFYFLIKGYPSGKLETLVKFIEENKETILKGNFIKGVFIGKDFKIYKNLEK